MIVGTAGHIDHGKTTLVRALTGVDTDRLPQEKARGISIDLGYAFLDTPGGQRIGFIDVPGHERLVHTMLAGATGIDHALLLVAADDGPMPQTHEHLAVLSLLGVDQGTVVLTKTDRVDAARVQAVAAQVQAMLEGSTLAGAPLLALSAASGQGMEALREQLARAAAQVGPHPGAAGAFRLAVDRVFSLAGVGTVVTGSVHAGTVRVGDELQIVPGQRRVRVKSVHAQNREAAQAVAGERCALALAGLDRGEVGRGQWLVAPAVATVAASTQRLDATLSLWPQEARALRSGTPVHVHLGAASTLGSVAVLAPDVIEPGASGLVQIVLREPIGAWHGDRVVLRDASASRTLAGGRVLDPGAPTRYRRTPARLAELDALRASSAQERLARALAVAPQGLDLQRFVAAQGLAQEPALPADALLHADGHGRWALDAAQAQQAQARVLAVLSDYHARHPDELGPDAARLRRLALPRLPQPLWLALLARAQAAGALVQRGAFVHRPEHGVRLSAAEERIAQKLGPALDAAGFEGAWVRDLARDHGESEPLLRVTLARLAQRGELHQVVRDLYLPQATVRRLVAIARDCAQSGAGELTAARFRDATGLGRKRAIQILEHFDRVGLLRRVGDAHRLRSDSAWLTEAA